jgi:nicotinic acetylcholine receptor
MFNLYLLITIFLSIHGKIKYQRNLRIYLLLYIEINGNIEAKRLLHELMKDYNRYVLPVQSINQTVNVTLGLKLSQLSDIDERNQIMTTNVWLEHVK